MRKLQDLVYPPKFAISILFDFFCHFVNSYSHAMSCIPYAKAKAVCKPFDMDKAHAKAKVETVQRLKARKSKQQTDAKQKAEVLRKLEDLSKLQGLRKDVQRIAVALEKLTSIQGQDSDNKQFSQPESKREETKVQESTEKEKQREQRIDRVEEEGKVEGQEEENRMEDIKEGSSSFSLIVYSVGTRILQFFIF